MFGKKNDRDGAAWHYRKAINLDPSDALPHRNLAGILHAQGNSDRAIDHLNKALDLDSKFFEAHYDLAVVLNDKKDFEGAVRHYRIALDLKPDHPQANFNFAHLLNRQDDLDGAIRHYQIAVESDPNYMLGHLGLGAALDQKGKIDDAIWHLRKGVELGPNYAIGHHNLGVALLNSMKDLDGAIRHFRIAVELDTKYSDAHDKLGRALSRKKDHIGAIQHYQKGLVLNPNYAEAHGNLANCLIEVGQFTEALKHRRLFHELGSKQPGWPYPSAKWVQDCEQMVKLDQQVPAVLKGDVRPASPQEWLAYVDVCQRKKDHASAFQLWNKLFLKHPTLAANFRVGRRVSAASDAVLASSKDARNILDADRVAMRKQGHEWLQAELDAWSEQLKNQRPQTVFDMANKLGQWQKHADLAAVRDEQKLAKFPDEERRPWQKLWADVEHQRKVAASMFKETTCLSGAVSTKERETVHEVKLKAGTVYVIDLESKAFDTFLVLMDAKGKKLAENDDIDPGIDTNSRLIFTPESDGVYRVVASAFQNSGTGPYTLAIREFIK